MQLMYIVKSEKLNAETGDISNTQKFMFRGIYNLLTLYEQTAL